MYPPYGRYRQSPLAQALLQQQPLPVPGTPMRNAYPQADVPPAQAGAPPPHYNLEPGFPDYAQSRNRPALRKQAKAVTY